jgi:hypothetical protein
MNEKEKVTAITNKSNSFKPSRSDELWFYEEFGLPYQWAQELIKDKGPMGEEVRRRIEVYLQQTGGET